MKWWQKVAISTLQIILINIYLAHKGKIYTKPVVTAFHFIHIKPSNTVQLLLSGVRTNFYHFVFENMSVPGCVCVTVGCEVQVLLCFDMTG